MNVRTLWHGRETKRGISLVEFVACQILEIMKSQIEAERVFNIAIICMNLRHLGWAQRILRCLLASTRTGLMMLGLRILLPCKIHGGKIHGDGGNPNG